MTNVMPEEWGRLRLVQRFWNKPSDVERIRRNSEFTTAALPPMCDVEDCVQFSVGFYATPDGRGAALCAGHAPKRQDA